MVNCSTLLESDGNDSLLNQEKTIAILEEFLKIAKIGAVDVRRILINMPSNQLEGNITEVTFRMVVLEPLIMHDLIKS